MKYSEARKLAKGLSELADLVETHGVKLGPTPYIRISTTFYDGNIKQQMANVARTIPGTLTKEHLSYEMALCKKFSGGITWRFTTSRSNVCEKVVTGIRVVPKYEQVGTKTEETFEWICTDPLLA